MYKNLGDKPCATRRLALHCLSRSALGLLGAPLLLRPGSAWAQRASPLKVGFVYVGPVSEAGWTTQHNLGRLQMEAALGTQVQTRFIEKVSEGPDAERVIRDLAAQGHELIFTTSFGFMEPTLKVAKEFPKVIFEHATGYKSATNVSHFNARFYEGRYLAGLLAGKMSRTGVVGYVAAFPIPEVLQGINAFMRGMQAVNPKAQMKVIWTSSWFDPGKERDAAITLINQAADVLTHHTDSTAVVQAAEEKGKFSVGYHSDMSKVAPKGHLSAVTHHWGAYYTQAAKAVIAGTWKPRDPGVWGGISEGFIKLSTIHTSVPKDFVARVLTAQADIASGKLHPFSGQILDNQGKVQLIAGKMTDAQLHQMNYLVAGVLGSVPKS
jgi:basic membrane protein A and related proteins